MMNASSLRKALILTALLAVPGIVGCLGSASQMAATKEGVSPSDIGECERRMCFMALGPEVLESKRENGHLVEIYRVRREKGSSLRSFAHGVLSVGTLGLWNVVGVPIEGYVSDDEYIVFRVTYDEHERATRVDIQS